MADTASPQPEPAPPRTAYLVKRLERLLYTGIEKAVGNLGLTASQYAALSVLGQHPGLSSAQLARRSFVTAQSMHEMVRGLERAELIARRADTANQRTLRIQLTERGAELLARCDTAVDAVESDVFDGASACEVATFRTFLAERVGTSPDSVSGVGQPGETGVAEAGIAAGAGIIAPVPDVPGELPASVGPGRSDQVRNRGRILSVALQLFAERGIDQVQLDDVAAAAGVGRATLFRHIGSKNALIHDIYQARLEDIGDLVADALTLSDPGESFEMVIRQLVRWLREDRGLYDYTRAMRRAGSADDFGDQPFSALDTLIDRARDAGAVWSSLRSADLIPLLAFAVEPDGSRLDDFTDLVLRGLRS